MLGIDSVSRLAMLREMPLLQQALAELEAISLLGYNKAGFTIVITNNTLTVT